MSLQQQEIGPEACPPRRPRNRVGLGSRKVPRQSPLIFRIANRSSLSVVACLSPISATARITRHRRAKPTRVVVQWRRRSKLESRNCSPCLLGVVLGISEIYPLAIT